MDNQLMRYSQGTEVVPKQDRAIAAKGKVTVDEVRFKALQADGAMALASHLMDGLIQLDAKAQSLAQGDPIKMAILMEIEAGAIRQCKNIQNSLYDNWGL